MCWEETEKLEKDKIVSAIEADEANDGDGGSTKVSRCLLCH